MTIIFLFNMVHIYDFCELQRNSKYNLEGSSLLTHNYDVSGLSLYETFQAN